MPRSFSSWRSARTGASSPRRPLGLLPGPDSRTRSRWSQPAASALRPWPVGRSPGRRAALGSVRLVWIFHCLCWNVVRGKQKPNKLACGSAEQTVRGRTGRLRGCWPALRLHHLQLFMASVTTRRRVRESSTVRPPLSSSGRLLLAYRCRRVTSRKSRTCNPFLFFIHENENL